MMIVQCKQCNSRYRLDEAKLKKPATKVKCPKCQNVFSVSMEEPTHVPKPQSITPPISKGLAPQEKTAVPGKMHALKRIISILAVLLIIITAGTGGFYLYQEYKGKGVTKGREITSFIPGNPLVYLRLTDTERHWSQFKKTRFYHQMINLPFWGDLKEIPGLRRLISGQGEWQGNIDLQIKENDIMEALGRDLHFAMYYPKNTQLPEALLITETTGKIKFLEILNQLGKKLKGKMASLTQETYQGQEINTVESIFGILNLYYTSFGGTFVISNTAGMIKKVIDLNKSTTPAPNCLKTNRIFQQAVKSLPPHRYGTFYLNYQVMLDFFNHLSAFKTEEKDQFKSFQQNFKPFKAMAAGLVFDQGIILKNCFFIHRKNLNHHQKTVFGLKPHRHLSLELMPQSTLFYLSMNSLDAPSYFSLWQEQMGLLSQKDQIPKINLEYWKDKLGINFEEKVLPLLGKEISLGIGEVNVNSPFPVPEIFLQIEIKDRKKAKTLMTDLLDSSRKNMRWGKFIPSAQEGVYLKYHYHYLSTPFISPAWTFLGKLLVIRNSVDGIKKAIDLFENKGKNLHNNPGFNKKKDLFHIKNNGICFINIKLLIETAVALADKFSVSLPSEKVAKYEEFLKPALKVFKAMGTFRTEVNYHNDRITSTAYLAFSDLEGGE